MPDHPLFWGDLCKSKVKYVRNFVFGDVNTLRACPFMPYRDRERPFVNAWFAAAEGSPCAQAIHCISEERQDALEEQGGACIMYTHFGHGYVEDGRLNERFASLMERLSRKNGWFVPVNVLLEHIEASRGIHELSSSERRRLERRWLLHKIRHGSA